jgi:large subunit ribosomal protein L31
MRLTKESSMKDKIHPKYVECKVTCACGNTFVTRSIKPELHLEICSNCHPYFTGKQKFVDTAGRVERFVKKFKWDERGQRPAKA